MMSSILTCGLPSLQHVPQKKVGGSKANSCPHIRMNINERERRSRLVSVEASASNDGATVDPFATKEVYNDSDLLSQFMIKYFSKVTSKQLGDLPYDGTYEGYVELSREIMKGRNTEQVQELVAGILDSILPPQSPERFKQWFPLNQRNAEINAWINFGGGQELWDELSAKLNIRAFQSANTGVQMGGWFRNEINSLDDFKGLKIRMPGLGGEVMRRLGAAAVSMPGGEIFPSMKSGAIDASEWVGPWNDMAFGFHQVAKYYYCPGFQEPGAMLATGINLDVWASLTAAQQEVLRTACEAENNATLSEYNYKNAAALETLVKKHNVEVRSF